MEDSPEGVLREGDGLTGVDTDRDVIAGTRIWHDEELGNLKTRTVVPVTGSPERDTLGLTTVTPVNSAADVL